MEKKISENGFYVNIQGHDLIHKRLDLHYVRKYYFVRIYLRVISKYVIVSSYLHYKIVRDSYFN
jgi:hypothetical protein